MDKAPALTRPRLLKFLFSILTACLCVCLPLHETAAGEPADSVTGEVMDAGTTGAGTVEARTEDRVVLNAERVSYNDVTGRASAQGDAELSYQGTTIRAERIDYDAQSQKVEAMPFPGQQVALSSSGRTIRGDHLDYDLTTREGILSGARSSVGLGKGTLYVYGSELSVVPWETAVEQGLVKGGGRGSAEDYLVQWRDVTLTTCALEHPHYRLVSKTISFIPGRSVTARKPRVYLGETYLFTSPLDYVVQLQRRAVRYSLIPYIQHSSSRGTGAGLTGTMAWDTGSFTLGFAWASEIGAEWLFEVEQDIGTDFTLMAGAGYTWDGAWDETIWRPYAALTFHRDGWEARLRWSRKEYIEDQKDSLYQYRGRLDRQPELTVRSPWFRTSDYSWLNLSAGWGSYREEIYNRRGKVTTRYGFGLHSYLEKELWPWLEFFSDTTGSVWFYDRDDADQETLRSFTGFRYRIGVFELGTAYERRYTWGEGAMLWDQYLDRRRIHQKIRFPIGRELYLAFRGSYDLEESMVDEMRYSLQWVSDCMKWDLHYTDDRTSGDDDKLGLSMYILAFPNTPASFGQSVETDPFDRPDDLPE